MHIPPNCGVTGFADKFGNALDENVAIHFLNILFGRVYLDITEYSDEEEEESEEEESEESENEVDQEAPIATTKIINKEPEHMMMPAKDSVECSIILTVTGDDISFLSGLNYSIPELMKSLEPKCGMIILADLGGAQTADVLRRSRVIISKLVWRKLGMGVKVKFIEFCPDQLREPVDEPK